MLKGWQFNGTDQPLEFVEKELPELKSGYCLIKVLACGLCHSDTSALHDPGWLELISTPRILGHETAGEIIAVIAAAVASISDGKKYAIKKVSRAERQTGGRSAWAASGIYENTRPF